MLFRKMDKYIGMVYAHLPFALENTWINAIMIKPFVISRATNVLPSD